MDSIPSPLRVSRKLVGAVLLATAVYGGNANAQASLEILTDTSTGAHINGPYGISADGSTLIGRTIDPAHPQLNQMPLYWTEEESFSIGPPPAWAHDGESRAVSADGSVVAVAFHEALGQVAGNRSEVFRWDAVNGLVSLGDLPGGPYISYVSGISADGSVIVGSGTIGPNTVYGTRRAVRWTSAGIEELPINAPSLFSAAFSVSADGEVIAGTAIGGGGIEAFRYTDADGATFLGDLPGGVHTSVSSAMSDDGTAIGGWGSTPAGHEAYLWTEETGMVGLGHLAGSTSDYSVVYDISANGKIAIGGDQTFYGFEPFVWDHAHGMRGLRDVIESYGIDLSEWQWLGKARGISEDGPDHRGLRPSLRQRVLLRHLGLASPSCVLRWPRQRWRRFRRLSERLGMLQPVRFS